jgi:hypothetical protein
MYTQAGGRGVRNGRWDELCLGVRWECLDSNDGSVRRIRRNRLWRGVIWPYTVTVRAAVTTPPSRAKEQRSILQSEK